MLSRFKKYPAYLRDVLINAPAVQNSAILYASNIATAAVGFASSIIVARNLGPADFGIIAVYNSIILTLTGFTDFGLGTGLIKFTAPLIKEDSKKSAAYFRFVFYAEIAIGAVLLVLGLIFTHEVAHFFGKTLSPGIVRLAVLAAAVTSTTAYVGAAFSAHKKFKLYALYSISVAVLRLGLIFALLLAHSISLYHVIYAYVALSFVSTLLGFIAVPKDYLQPAPNKVMAGAAKDIFKFSGWLTLSFIITSIAGRLDFFYLYKLRGSSVAGVYAIAIQLSLVYSLLVGAISTVLTPYISEKVSLEAMRTFLRRTLPLVSLGAIALAASGIVAPFVIKLFFGIKYIGATGPLRIMAVEFALNLILIPISLMYIPLGKVRIGTIIAAMQLAIAFLLYPILIHTFGANGAASTEVINAIIALILYSVILVYLLRKDAVNAQI